MKFTPIIHPSISNHCVGIQVSDTQIMPCFRQLFWVGNNITGSSTIGVGRLNIGALNEGGRRIESIDLVLALCGSSLHSKHSKLSDITAGKLSVKSQFITHNSNKAMASEWYQSPTHGFHRVRKAAIKRKCGVQYESVLDQKQQKCDSLCTIIFFCDWEQIVMFNKILRKYAEIVRTFR